MAKYTIAFVRKSDHTTNYLYTADGELCVWDESEVQEQMDILNKYPAKYGRWVAVQQYDRT